MSIHIPPILLLFADKMSPIALTKIYKFFNKLDTCYVCILEGMFEENITKSILFGDFEPNIGKDFLSNFPKNTQKYHQNLTVIKSSGVYFEWSCNKFCNTE